MRVQFLAEHAASWIAKYLKVRILYSARRSAAPDFRPYLPGLPRVFL